MRFKENILRIMDIIGGAFLVIAGLFLVYLYFCLRSKANNWFIALSALLFFLGLGVGAIILGARRIFSAFKDAVHHRE
jgi:hypothetical protein